MERDWLRMWPRGPKELEGDVERLAVGSSEPVHEFLLVEPRDPPNPPPPEPLSIEQALTEIIELYKRPVRALYNEDPPKKRGVDWVEWHKENKPPVPTTKQKTIFKPKVVESSGKSGRRIKVRGWVATDPSWRIIVGHGKTKCEAEDSLRVQIAWMAWRWMGGSPARGRHPLPAMLYKLGKTWVAYTCQAQSPTFAVGSTIEEALFSLVEILGMDIGATIEVGMAEKPSTLELLDDRDSSAWYGRQQ